MKQCSECQEYLSLEDSYCPNCGTKVTDFSVQEDKSTLDEDREEETIQTEFLDKKKTKVIVSVLLVIVVLFGIFSIGGLGLAAARQYEITFSSCGGTPYSSLKSNGNQYLNLPQPIRSGYSFGGWYTKPNGAGANIINTTYNNKALTSNIILYARWFEYYSQSFSHSNYTNYVYITYQASSMNSITVSCSTLGRFLYIDINTVYVNVWGYTTLSFTESSSKSVYIPSSYFTSYTISQKSIINNVYGSVTVLRPASPSC